MLTCKRGPRSSAKCAEKLAFYLAEHFVAGRTRAILIRTPPKTAVVVTCSFIMYIDMYDIHTSVTKSYMPTNDVINCHLIAHADGVALAMAADTPRIKTLLMTCKQLLKLPTVNNFKAVKANAINQAIAHKLDADQLCTLKRPNKNGSMQLSAGKNHVITYIVFRYLAQGAGATMEVNSTSGRHQTVVSQTSRIFNVTSPIESSTTHAADVWIPNAVAVPFPALPQNITLTLAAFPNQRSAIRLVSVQVTIAASVKRTKREALLKSPPPPVLNATTANSTQVFGVVSTDIYKHAPKSSVMPDSGGIMLQSRRIGFMTGIPAMDIADLIRDRSIDMVQKAMEAYKNVAVEGTTACYRDDFFRGVGKVPLNCDDWKLVDGAVCREPCAWNYEEKVCSEVCWELCHTISNEGWHDHGLTCHLPMHSYG
jgi:hypothetical protein